MSKTNYIVINGNKYNAKTGELISPSTAHVDKVSAGQATHSTPRSMDGVARPKARAVRSEPKHKKKPVQRSTTLMRKAVKKPSERTTTSVPVSGITKSRLGTRPGRIEKATSTARSPHIQKYGIDNERSSVRKSMIAELPVKQPSQRDEPKTPHVNEEIQSSQQHSQISNAAHTMIESALHSAKSHNQILHSDHEPKKKRLHHKLGVSKRVMQFASGGLAALLLVGFFALQNVPNLSMRVAAARSGVDSSMPSYTPSGFAFNGPIDYSDGVVTVSFRTNTDERQYTVSQQNSGWTSDSLLAEFVATSTSQYQTYLDGRGRTLYIYDKNNATWVQDGIWYKVEGESKLTTDQLARLAASM